MNEWRIRHREGWFVSRSLLGESLYPGQSKSEVMRPHVQKVVAQIGVATFPEFIRIANDPKQVERRMPLPSECCWRKSLMSALAHASYSGCAQKGMAKNASG